MIKEINNNKAALIILHEIYGINRFIKDICSEYHIKGFDVFCPDILQGKSYKYSEADAAYDYFKELVGFDYYVVVEQLLEKLKLTYDKLFMIGFSVGATIAWRCCENNECNGIICCYESRIRDYLALQPSCPVLLLFAEQDSFDVDGVVKQLIEKPNMELYKLHAGHGFMDQYSHFFNREQAQISKQYIKDFLKWHS